MTHYNREIKAKILVFDIMLNQKVFKTILNSCKTRVTCSYMGASKGE